MCIFCKIVNKEIPSYTIYEDNTCVAFLDLSQANIGHTLVVSKKHYNNILDITENDASHIFSIVPKITKKISEVLNIKDFNILNNCGKEAGQTIDHFHIHIIPRLPNDSIKMEFGEHKLTDEGFKELSKKLSL